MASKKGLYRVLVFQQSGLLWSRYFVRGYREAVAEAKAEMTGWAEEGCECPYLRAEVWGGYPEDWETNREYTPKKLLEVN